MRLGQGKRLIVGTKQRTDASRVRVTATTTTGCVVPPGRKNGGGLDWPAGEREWKKRTSKLETADARTSGVTECPGKKLRIDCRSVGIRTAGKKKGRENESLDKKKHRERKTTPKILHDPRPKKRRAKEQQR